MSVVKMAVTAAQIAMVLKRGADEATIEHQIKGIAGLAKSLREKITVVEASIVIHAVKNKTTKYATALVDCLTEEKKNAEAKAVIAWFEANGFRKQKHPDTGKYEIGFVKDKIDAMAERIKTDELGLVTELLATPYHLSIKKEDAYRDYSLIDRLFAEVKRAEKIKDEFDDRTSKGVKTNLAGLAEIKKALAALNH